MPVLLVSGTFKKQHLIKGRKNDIVVSETRARSFHPVFDRGRTWLSIARVRFVCGKKENHTKDMATCVCAGDMCACEAIKVHPELSFWQKHDRNVHGFVAWMAVLNAAMLAALPMTL